MSRSQRFALATLAMAVACAFLLAAARAGAAYDPVASGTTEFTLAPSFTALLKENGVHLAGSGGVTVKGNTVAFPVETGKLEPVAAKGVVEHAGTLVFRTGAKSLPLRSLQLKSTRRSAPYAAKLGGGQLKLASAKSLTSTRVGFGTRFRASGLRLSAKVATRLEKKLGLRDVFAAGQRLGTATSAVAPASVSIKAAGKAELAIDPAFAAKLQSLFVAVNPIFPAEHPGAFTLPIGGGTLALGPGIPASGLKAQGALELIQVGGGQFFARELEFDLSDSLVNGESQLVLAASGSGPNQGGAIFSLGPTLVSSDTNRELGVSAAPLQLEPGTAQAFNEAFAKPLRKPDAFSAGETFGTITFTAQAE